MHIDFLHKIFEQHKPYPAIIWNDTSYDYEWLQRMINYYQHYLRSNGVVQRMVVGIQGDFSPNSIALILALIDNSNIIVPLSGAAQSGIQKKTEIAQVEMMISLDEHDNVAVQKVGCEA